MRIYNLFPRLAGRFSRWTPHFERAAAMGFDWIFINPIQQTGRSGSLYSIKDYFGIDPAFLEAQPSGEQQVQAMVRAANGLGMRVMVDLVINHCAYDSPLLGAHPEWFVRENGRIAHPSCNQDGRRVVWEDLAQFDFRAGAEREALVAYCLEIVRFLCRLGFNGFRCDAAYQLPPEVWEYLIREIKREWPDTVFVAETLGCSPDQTRRTAQAGFDAIFNSSKWWDFSSPWLLEQYQLTREVALSIGFPESHDTPRLMEEAHGNVDVLKQRYLFTALFSGGVMMPVGYEFGFRRPLHVVATRPEDWEPPACDLTGFIRAVNEVKARCPVFQEDSVTQPLPYPNPAILLMWKAGRKPGEEALLVFNKDPWNRQCFRVDDIYQYVQGRTPLRDLSPEWRLDYVPVQFEFELAPGMGRVLVTGTE
ncbi:alpha-amylase family glycosyl hydrolase [Methylococcus capsulatus]|uniref:alpha-amylase family glycosyl hydrolase n=1 Tax=Methylococcus capsulatus TaxID=414 RepID=UPI0020174BE3|nr:alpha-amylase family glycosyl hydrolase [Methylococcus capsulatus]UQN11817.1 alpha-amylase family glycosyl hydrolase [Methylococcus capsulatus]